MSLLFCLAVIDEPIYQEKFSDIYIQYEKLVLKIAYEYTKNVHDAEDAAQDAFLGIAKNIKNIDLTDSQKIKIYVCVAAKNAAINFVKKRNKTDIPSDALLLNVEGEINIEDDLIQDEETATLAKALAKLPEKYRDALTFKYLCNMSRKEIANLLHITENTVKSNLKRGKRMLLEALTEKGAK